MKLFLFHLVCSTNKNKRKKKRIVTRWKWRRWNKTTRAHAVCINDNVCNLSNLIGSQFISLKDIFFFFVFLSLPWTILTPIFSIFRYFAISPIIICYGIPASKTMFLNELYLHLFSSIHLLAKFQWMLVNFNSIVKWFHFNLFAFDSPPNDQISIKSISKYLGRKSIMCVWVTTAFSCSSNVSQYQLWCALDPYKEFIFINRIALFNR